jgi:hypothetical protein
MRRFRLFRVLAVFVALAGLLAACGGDDDDGDAAAEAPTEDTGDEGTEEEEPAPDEEGDADDGDGGDGGGCLEAGEVGDIVGFEVSLDDGSSGPENCTYTSTDPEQIGSNVSIGISEGGATDDISIDTTRETLEELFPESVIEDADIGDGGFFLNAGIVVELVYADGDDLYTLVLGGLELEDPEDKLAALAAELD